MRTFRQLRTEESSNQIKKIKITFGDHDMIQSGIWER